MIQKNIFQTFFTKDIPSQVQKIIAALKKQNPEYEYHFYDDLDIENFIKQEYGKDVQRAYNALQIGAAKADLWRYLVLYRYGGVYIDIDSCINKPLKDFIKETDKAILTRESHPGMFVQWGLFFCKQHPLLKKVIQQVVHNILFAVNKKIVINDYISLYKMTGPKVFSDTIEGFYTADKTSKTVYESTDADLELKIAVDRPDHARFFGYDYNGVCSFKHPSSDYLDESHTGKKSWVKELQTIPLIKW